MEDRRVILADYRPAEGRDRAQKPCRRCSMDGASASPIPRPARNICTWSGDRHDPLQPALRARATPSKAGFRAPSAYESQEKRKLVSCPVCGSAKVERAIMAPQIVSKKGREVARARAGRCRACRSTTTPESTPLLMAQERELRAKLKELRDHIVQERRQCRRALPQRSAQDALRRYRAPPDLRRGLARGSPRPDRRRRRGLAAAGAAGRPELIGGR